MMSNRTNIEFTDARMIGGLIIEFISGVVFYLYFRCASQLSSFCVCVERMSRFLLANKMCDQLDKDKNGSITRSELVKIIANAPMITADQMNAFYRKREKRINGTVNAIDSSMT